jgi:hypothetical protein
MIIIARMMNKNILTAIVFLLFTVPTLLFAGCSTESSRPGGIGATVIQSDSIITGEIRAIRAQSTGYPWEIDILVQSSENVENLPNPTADKVGLVITARTDEDLSSLKVGQKITANVKYVGDVPKPGISLYIYDIKIT